MTILFDQRSNLLHKFYLSTFLNNFSAMVDQEVQRRRGEIFFLWLSVLSVILGYALTSTASSDHPNDIWFITGVISGFLGSIFAFGFVLYISICSEYHYQDTVSNKETPSSEIRGEKETRLQKCLENNTKARNSPVNGKEERIAPQCLGNGKEEKNVKEQHHANVEIVPEEQLEIRKRKNVTPEFPERIAKPSDMFLDEEKMDYTINPQPSKTDGKTDFELEMLQRVEYVKVQEILNKATKMLQEFSLIAENLEVHRKLSCDTSSEEKTI